MKHIVTLVSLPADVIRRIVAVDNQSLSSMRLISRKWNASVLEKLRDPSYLLPMERLYFTNGIALPDAYKEYGAKDPEITRRLAEAKNLIHMYAIIPDQCTRIVGVGKWLNVHAEYASGDTEVTCAPQELASVSTSIRLFPFMSPRNKMAKRKSERFTRFFRSFSYIEKLVFRHLNSITAMDQITATLANVRISQLEVSACECDEPLQKRIIELTRKHTIRFVTIVALRCDMKTLGRFLHKLIKLGAIVDIYEYINNKKRFDELREYFHRPIDYWAGMSIELERKGVSLNISTLHDLNFDISKCPVTARTHISCTPVGYVETEHNRPTGVHRGFFG